MVDWLGGLMARRPWLTDVPVVMGLLLFCIVLFVFGFRHPLPHFWQGRMGAALAVCYRQGCGLLIFWSLLGCAYLPARGLPSSPGPITIVFIVLIGLSWLLLVVPCLFQGEYRRRQKQDVLRRDAM